MSGDATMIFQPKRNGMNGSKGKHASGIGLEENAAAFGQLDVTVTNNN